MDIKELIKYEYENGSSITSLSKKYNQKVGTIKSWVSREKWVKKKGNIATTKKENATNKRNQLQPLKNDIQTQIKRDIINNATSHEIVQKFAVSERTFYNYKKNVRQFQIEYSEKFLNSIAEEKYKDVNDRLKNIADKKYELEIELLKSGIYDAEKMLLIEKRLKLLKEFEKDIKSNARIINDYRQAELEEQLVNEQIQKEKLELEKSKNKIEDENININIEGV